MLMSAETFRGMTVLFVAPELTMFAMEKDGSRQTLTSSSTGRPHASETCCRMAISSGVLCETASSACQHHYLYRRAKDGCRLTKSRYIHPLTVRNRIEHLDHVEHGLRDRSSVDT